MTAADVVVHKAILADDLRQPIMMDYLDNYIAATRGGDFAGANFASDKIFPRGWEGAHEAQDLGRALAVGESYYVAANMVELAIHASEHMPDEPLLAHDPPSTHGFMWLATPWRVIDIRRKLLSSTAVAWATRGGLIKVWWLTSKYDEDDSVNARLRADSNYHRMMPLLTPSHIGAMLLGEELPRGISWDTALPPDANVSVEWVDNGDGTFQYRLTTDEVVDIRQEPVVTRDKSSAFLLTLWRLCQQTIASRQREPLKPRLSWILRKANLPDRPVTIIALRKRSGEHGDSTVEWSHRWIVRGHWRRQQCKDADGTWTHRMVYINPYLKGPEGAPLLVREHVNALVR